MSAEPRWRRLEPDERRQQILGCAVRLFGERPYEDVSTTDIAREAGVARGLVNHYFGTKKDLYLEVVRVMVTIPDVALQDLPEGDLETRVDASVAWFLEAVSKHAKPWLAAIGATGSTRDAEVAQLLAEADEETADRILDATGMNGGATGIRDGAAGIRDGAAGMRDGAAGEAPERLRALARAYVGFARTAAVEWLVRGSLTRTQVHVLLTHTLVTLLSDTYRQLPDDGPAADLRPRRAP